MLHHLSFLYLQCRAFSGRKGIFLFLEGVPCRVKACRPRLPTLHHSHEIVCLTCRAPCRSFSGPKDSFLFFESGPRVVQASLLSSPIPGAAADDANACSTTFPDTNAVVRLIFGSGVREASPTGALVPLGAGQATDAAAALERIQGMFNVKSAGPGKDDVALLGLGDVDPDNVIDLCLSLPVKYKFALPIKVELTCEEAEDDALDFVVRDPTGDACAPQTVNIDISGFDFSGFSSH